MVQEIGIGQLIREHPFFEGMGGNVLELIAGCGKNERYDPGEYVFREGQPADKFYLIRHGSIALEIRSADRGPLILQTCDEGDVMGWSWMVPPYRWQWDARAVRLTRVVSFDAVCLRGKMEADPVIGNALLSRFICVMAERLSAARMQMLDLYGNGGK